MGSFGAGDPCPITGEADTGVGAFDLKALGTGDEIVTDPKRLPRLAPSNRAARNFDKTDPPDIFLKAGMAITVIPSCAQWNIERVFLTCSKKTVLHDARSWMGKKIPPVRSMKLSPAIVSKENLRHEIRKCRFSA